MVGNDRDGWALRRGARGTGGGGRGTFGNRCGTNGSRSRRLWDE